MSSKNPLFIKVGDVVAIHFKYGGAPERIDFTVRVKEMRERFTKNPLITYASGPMGVRRRKHSFMPTEPKQRCRRILMRALSPRW